MAEDKFTVEDDLPAAWDKLIVKLEVDAGLKLPWEPSGTPQQRLQEVLTVIKSADAEPDITNKTIEVVNNAFTAIDRLGSMIVQASTIVFGPSAQMWNVISFLIHAAKDTKAVFDNLAVLMERTIIFLERLSGYLDDKIEGEKLDLQLRRRFYAALEQFTKIMVLSYKLTHSWQEGENGLRAKCKKVGGRVVAFVKVGAYGDDSGVKAAMAAFETCVSDISGIQIDIIHRSLSEAAKKICVMEDTVGKTFINTENISLGVDKLNEANANKDVKETVRRFLDIDIRQPESNSTDQEFSTRLPSTGMWLLRHDAYESWTKIDITDQANTCFGIAAPTGYGKSFLTYTVMLDLDEKCQASKQQVSTRIVSYYFPKERKTADNAVRNIIWQLTLSNASFRDFIYGIAREKGPAVKNLTNPEFWARTIATYGANRPQHEVLYIVLDGLDNIDHALKDDLKQIIRASNGITASLQLRFFLTGDKVLLQEIQRDAKIGISMVDLFPSSSTPASSLPHQEDIKRFIQHHLELVPIFKDDTSKSIEELKSQILINLQKAARGSYIHIEQQIREINRAEDLSEVEKLLKQLDRDGKEMIKEEINHLNRRLPGPRIRHLNEILAWVSVAQTPELSVSMMKSVLELKFGSAGIKDIPTWIRKNCPRLLKIEERDDESWLAFQPDAKDVLLATEEIRDTVSGAEIDMIRAMLKTSLNRTFGSDTIFERFEFDAFFEEKRAMTQHLVHLKSPQESSPLVLQTCLQAVCELHEDKRPEFEELRSYARDYFDEHLVLSDISKLELADKTQLGRGLYRALKEDIVIDTWANENHIWSMLDWFLYQDNTACAAMLALLRDLDVQHSIEAVYKDTDWLYAEDIAGLPNESILQHVAQRVLQRTYNDEFNRIDLMMMWLRAYFWKTGDCPIEYRKKSIVSRMSVKELRLLENWARPQVEGAQDAKWHYLMAGWCAAPVTSVSRRMLRKACKRCEQAFELDSSLWRAQLLKTRILVRMKDPEGCISALNSLQTAMQLGIDDEYDKVYWEEVVLRMGDCYIQLGDHSAGASWFARSVQHHLEQEDGSPDLGDVTSKLIAAYREQNQVQLAFEALKSIDEKKKKNRNKSWLAGILEEPASDLHDQLILLAYSTDALKAVSEYYNMVLQGLGEEAKKSGVRKSIEFTRDKLNLYCNPARDRQAILPNWQALASHLREHETHWSWYTRRSLIIEFAKLCISVATDPQISVHEQEAMAKRLSAFSEVNNDMSGYGLYRESKLVLARMLHVSGKAEKARDVLKPLVESAIEQAQAEDLQESGYLRLAQIFPVLNDDINALAAWSALCPTDEYRTKPTESGIVSSDTNDLTIGIHKEPSLIEDYSSDDDDIEPFNSEEDKDNIDGMLNFDCAGKCGRDWPYSDDMMVCRECLDVQLCPPCHAKLRIGRLPVTMCDPKHNFLHVPPFNLDEWRAIDKADIKVGQNVIAREVWLKQLRQDWGLEDYKESLTTSKGESQLA